MTRTEYPLLHVYQHYLTRATCLTTGPLWPLYPMTLIAYWFYSSPAVLCWSVLYWGTLYVCILLNMLSHVCKQISLGCLQTNLYTIVWTSIPFAHEKFEVVLLSFQAVITMKYRLLWMNSRWSMFFLIYLDLTSQTKCAGIQYRKSVTSILHFMGPLKKPFNYFQPLTSPFGHLNSNLS